ncbi:hypothetical protein PACILC2_43360 [Paenibacillus cisolokensis]|uniref:Uncharacterized protein n=1 Tax=Paenibacillus cisolokensis TaxID=1658519 RepID=A0ABQ4NC24_9BACL|nr:hypothetical protein [Paenibacillus cisolokensis]GIQ65768.1 hypothetical protein PACILC2_43360 [Paenibacillus cisolokensis]
MGDVTSFQDLFKKSVLHLEAFRNVSFIDVVIGLIASFAIGMFIYFIYRKRFAESCTATTTMCRSC